MARISLTQSPLYNGWANARKPILPGQWKALEIMASEMREHRQYPPVKSKTSKGIEEVNKTRGKGQSPSNEQASKRSDKKTNQIIILDITQGKSVSSGVKNYDYLVLPTVPRELDFQTNANWAVVASIARNSPFFHYTGSEDTLNFTIDWYSKQEDRKDVINYCRWLEARSKADGYLGDPHKVILHWGESDKLFSGMEWIVQKASYKLTHFHPTKDALPCQAYQEVSLKLVTKKNLTYEDIQGYALKTPLPTISGYQRSLTNPKGI